MKRGTVFLFGGLCVAAALAAEAQTVDITHSETSPSLRPRHVRPKPDRTEITDACHREAVVVKIVQPSKVRLRAGELISLDRAHDVATLDQYLRGFPGLRIERMFQRSEEDLEADKRAGEANTGVELGDLNLYFLIDLSGVFGVDPGTFVDGLNALAEVEIAYPLPKSEPASVISKNGGIHSLQVAGADGLNDFEPLQGYLDPAPTGIDAEWAWTLTGGRGANVRFVDIEGHWNTNHIDHPAEFLRIPGGYTTPAPFCDLVGPPANTCAYPSNHGTSVVGEVVALDNGWGITGIATDAQYGISSHSSTTSWPIVANEINLAAAALSPGDIILYEMHAKGPPSGGNAGGCNKAQFEFIPMEYWQANFDATATAVAQGIHVVEAAGNGQMNLDNPIYGGLFNRSVRDSGAIIVSGASSTTHGLLCWTNWGSRVDFHAWGNNIVTTGQGDYYAFFPQTCPPTYCSTNHDSLYTDTFGGSSGASPIIVGAAAIVEGVSETKYGRIITPAKMREFLARGATPQGPPTTRNIGPMPDLEQVIRADLLPHLHSGWTATVLPRGGTGCTGGSCDVTPTLPGNSSLTYFNFAGRNDGIYETAPLEARLYIDDVWVRWASWGAIQPGVIPTATNLGPHNIRGGRHTVRATWDPVDLTPEWNENNNSQWGQYVWTPYALTVNTPVRRSAPPDRDTTGYYYYNNEGFKTTGIAGSNSWWVGTAVLPVDAADDFDVRLHEDEPTSTSGYGVNVAYSSWGAGYSDFVLQNGNIIGSTASRWPGVLQGSGTPGFGDVVVHASSGNVHSNAVGGHGAYDLGSGEVLDVQEFYFSASQAGTTFDFNLDNLGSADLGFSLYDAGLPYASKSQHMNDAYADSQGAGGDELFSVTIPVSGWYALAVWKSHSSDRLLSSDYTVEVAVTLPNLEPYNPPAWASSVVLRNSVGCTTTTCADSATLAGNSNLSYLSHAGRNTGPNTASGTYRTQYTIDGVSWGGFQSSADVPPAGTFFHLNYPSLFPIRGGRHTLGIEVDSLDGVAESDEGDNAFYKQYVLSPLRLVDDLPVTRSAPPDRDTPGAIYFNCDGLSYVSGWWGAAAVMPLEASDNYDVRLHDDYGGSTTGFQNVLAASSDGPGQSDFVMVNGNQVGNGSTWYAGVIQATGTPAAGDVAVHYVDESVTLSAPIVWGPAHIPANGVIHIAEMELNSWAGRTLHFRLDNQSAAVDLGFGIFDAAGSYFRKADALVAANNGVAGADEEFTFAVPVDGFYAIVVWKVGSPDLALSSDFSLEVGEILPTAVPDGTGGSEMLRVRRTDPTTLRVTWGQDCNAALLESDYTLYTGDLDRLRATGAWDYTADAPICSTGSEGKATVPLPTGNRFFLAVPHDGSSEGSYGRSSSGLERPGAGAAACRTQTLSGTCM